MALHIGCLKSYRKLIESFHIFPNSSIFYQVIVSDNIDIIQYSFSKNEFLDIIDFEFLVEVIKFGWSRDRKNLSLVLGKLFTFVNPLAQNYITIKIAINNYKYDELEYILSNTKPGNDLNYDELLLRAVKNSNGYNKIVKILLKFGTNISENDSFALKVAINCNYVKIVKSMLKYSKIVYNDKLLYRAAKNGCWKIIELLLNNKHIEYINEPNINCAINIAKKFERNKAIQTLVSFNTKNKTIVDR
jgi:hypothetical protein